MNEPKTVYLFPNGSSAVFNEGGEQIGKLQKSWMIIWIEWMVSQGVDPLEIKEIKTPSGDVKIFKTEDGWNWGTK